MTLLEPGQEITATVVRDSLDGSVAIMVDLPRTCVTSWQAIADLAEVYPKALINGRPLSVRCCSTSEQIQRNEVTLIVECVNPTPEVPQ